MLPQTYGTEQFTDQNKSNPSHSVADVVRENPGPALLVGAGLVWFFVEQEKKRNRSLATRLQSQANSLVDTAKSSLDSAKSSFEGAQESGAEALQSSKQAISRTLHAAEDTVQQQASKAVDQMVHLKNENPMMLGVLAAITGVAFGLMLPTTRTENRVMGPVRDQLLENAQAVASDIKSSAVESLETGRQAVKDTVADAGAEIKSVLSDTVDEVKHSVNSELNKAQTSKDSINSNQQEPMNLRG